MKVGTIIEFQWGTVGTYIVLITGYFCSSTVEHTAFEGRYTIKGDSNFVGSGHFRLSDAKSIKIVSKRNEKKYRKILEKPLTKPC